MVRLLIPQQAKQCRSTYGTSSMKSNATSGNVRGELTNETNSLGSAQTSAVCQDGFGWMSNSRAQSPCLVAAYLEGACGTGCACCSFLDRESRREIAHRGHMVQIGIFLHSPQATAITAPTRTRPISVCGTFSFSHMRDTSSLTFLSFPQVRASSTVLSAPVELARDRLG